tara:strand:+ start:2057 stop:2242 length:186 start_codon:yes stop_codon:yes gene_type:complete
MKIITKKLEKSDEYICYLKDSTGNNIKAVLGKDLADATAKMLDSLCFEMVGPATLKKNFVS